MSVLNDHASVVDAIYDAGVGETSWAHVGRMLEARLLGPTAIFVRTDRGVGTLTACSNLDECRALDYVERLWTEDRAMTAIGRSVSNEAVCDTALISDSDRGRSEFYGSYLPQVNAGRGLYVPVFRSRRETVVVSVQRPRSMGEYRPAELDFVQHLQPHFGRALRASRRLTETRRLQDAGLIALAQIQAGIILANAQGEVRFMSSKAESLLPDYGLSVRNGKLFARRSDLQGPLCRAVATAAKTASVSAEEIVVPSSSGSLLLLCVAPLRRGHQDLTDEPLALLTLGAPAPQRCAVTHFARRYQLSGAERRLLAALVEGTRLSDYAEDAGVALSTVKSHLSTIFDKSGQRRQADLIRFVLAPQDEALGT